MAITLTNQARDMLVNSETISSRDKEYLLGQMAPKLKADSKMTRLKVVLLKLGLMAPYMKETGGEAGKLAKVQEPTGMEKDM